jgi:hypothetical protein
MKYIFDPALPGQVRKILPLFTELAKAHTALEYLDTVCTVLNYIGKASTHYWIEQGIKQGRIQSSQDNILDLIDIRFSGGDEEMKTQVTAVSDLTILRQVYREAAAAVSLAAFMETLAALTATE